MQEVIITNFLEKRTPDTRNIGNDLSFVTVVSNGFFQDCHFLKIALCVRGRKMKSALLEDLSLFDCLGSRLVPVLRDYFRNPFVVQVVIGLEKMILASCCRKYCCFPFVQNQDRDENASTVPDLRDLVLKPQIINSTLDEKINNWQAALNELRDIEAEMTDNESDSVEDLARIKSNPWLYQNHENENYSYFANLVIRVIECERLLPQQSDGESIRSQRSNSTKSASEWSEATLNENSPNGNQVLNKLSGIWSNRLNHINQTQGALVISSNQEELRLKPKWPDFLVDVAFDVIKVNKYGHKMHRTLKLTQNHVISIKSGAAVTKFYPFTAISRVWLQNETTIRVKLRNDKINMYISPIAPHILQQITTRVQVRKTLDDKFIDEKTSQIQGYSSNLTAQIIKSISEENKYATEEMLLNFANELKARTLIASTSSAPSASTGFEIKEPESSTAVTSNTESVNTDGNKVDDEAIASPLHADNFTANITANVKSDETETENKDVPPPPPASSPERKAARPDSSASQQGRMSAKLSNFLENTPEYMVQDAVRRLVFDPISPEGNTRRVFLQKFATDALTNAEEDLTKLRHFIDGMHEYILNERAYALSVVYQQSKQRNLAAKAIQDQPGLTSSSPQISNKRKSTMPVNSLTRRASLATLMKKDKQVATGTIEIEETLLTVISYVIFVVVEESIFTSHIQDKIFQVLKLKSDYVEEELMLVDRMNAFRYRGQEQWGIPNEFVSPLGWQTAIFILSNLESSNTPTMQLQVLTRAVKAIYSEFKHAVIPKLKNEGKNADIFIAADDLVPIFIYVFCQTKLQHPLQNRELMWSLCHPDSLHGEGGYYLTVYESAIEYILNEPMEREAYVGENELEIAERKLSMGGVRESRVKSTSVVDALLKIPGILAFKDRNSDIAMQMSFQ